ncbi:MAG: alpha/beta hydrolase-fold protein [Thermodesulfobacteriota bacterium]|nr:alpha/beta hydrolase-fold protein [Thermodesulfobacteriota bacterium]
MKKINQNLLWVVLLCVLILFAGFFETSGAPHPCCPDDPELSYLLSPKPSQRFQYLVRYETFFSSVLGKEKGFFVILPEEYYQNPRAKYPLLFLLHGYNFHRRGFGWKNRTKEKAKEILCEVKEEEYHWLLHEDIAIIAQAMMDSKNRTYRVLERSLEERFEELSRHGGLSKEDYAPKQIAQSIVSHNLNPGGSFNDLFHPIQKMTIVLPDGDNGFYTDENEGRALYPETKDRSACDDFNQEEGLNYSLFPFLHMKPGALGKHESYFFELLKYIDSQSPYQKRGLSLKGLGGISMGGFGAIKLGFKYPHLFQSISSQSGLLNIELLTDKWALKMVLPEFLEVFGRLETRKLPPGSFLDLKHIRKNNPLNLLKQRGIKQLPPWIYFDYGEKEGYSWITEGNQNFEKALDEKSHQISVQPFNGKAGHNYHFWRSRSGNILQHHSNVFQKVNSERLKGITVPIIGDSVFLLGFPSFPRLRYRPGFPFRHRDR